MTTNTHIGRGAATLDHAKRGDDWTYDRPTRLGYCSDRHDGWACSRLPRHTGQHIAGDGGKVLAIWPSQYLPVGTRVRVLYRNTDRSESENYDGALGTVIHVDTVNGGSGLPYNVRWDDAEEKLSDTGWVHAVEALPTSDPDTLAVDDQYTSPVTQEHRCLDHSGAMFCSRPKDHTGQHLAAASHDGLVLEVWPNESETVKVGDCVRVTAMTEQTGLFARCVGRTGYVTAINGDGDPVQYEVRFIDGDSPLIAWCTTVVRTENVTPAEAERDRLREEVRVLQAQAREHAEWKVSLAEDAHRYADHNDFCSEFDDFMEGHDLPRRGRPYRVRMRVTLDLDVDIDSADSQDDAQNRANDVPSESIQSAIYLLSQSKIDVSEWVAQSADLL